jgi:hypothetical protein
VAQAEAASLPVGAVMGEWKKTLLGKMGAKPGRSWKEQVCARNNFEGAWCTLRHIMTR